MCRTINSIFLGLLHFAVLTVQTAEAQSVYWTDMELDSIQRSNLDGSDVEHLATVGGNPWGMALDHSANKMYWADPSQNTIQRANLDGSNVEVLVSAGLADPVTIALDVENNKMYWSDSASSITIWRSNLDGSMVEALLGNDDGVRHPRGIALDLTTGKIYICDQGEHQIKRANLDGSNLEILFDDESTNPTQLALDVESMKMYWTDRGTNLIRRTNFDGSNTDDLVSLPQSNDARGLALALPINKLYWTDGDGMLLRANLNGGQIEVIAAASPKPAGLAIDLRLLHPGVVDGVDHDIRKNRVITIKPNLGTLEARLRVELLDLACDTSGQQCNGDSDCKICDTGPDMGDSCSIDSDCTNGVCVASGESCDEQGPPLLLGYVGTPMETGNSAPPGTLRAGVLDDPPAFRSWPETLVHITDCEIAPARTYGISVETTKAPGVFSGPLVINTTPKPQGKLWGDLVGDFDGAKWSGPDSLVSVNDVLAMLKFISLKPAPHVTVVELVGAGPTYANFVVNATELQTVLKAFKGASYPPSFLLPAGYPNLQAGASLADCTGN